MVTKIRQSQFFATLTANLLKIFFYSPLSKSADTLWLEFIQLLQNWRFRFEIILILYCLENLNFVIHDKTCHPSQQYKISISRIIFKEHLFFELLSIVPAIIFLTLQKKLISSSHQRPAGGQGYLVRRH